MSPISAEMREAMQEAAYEIQAEELERLDREDPSDDIDRLTEDDYL